VTFPASYYEDLQGKLRALLAEVSGRLPVFTVDFVTELIEQNEPGVALETMSEMLAEARREISATTLDRVSELTRTMGLDQDNVDRLRPLVATETNL
jgi:hypothetical protein